MAYKGWYAIKSKQTNEHIIVEIFARSYMISSISI